MLFPNSEKLASGIFITFSGNCKEALTFYQSCFGGTLEFETFEQPLEGYTKKPVISACLMADSIVIHGSDLVHNEGRRIGNYLSIFLPCNSENDRKAIVEKLQPPSKAVSAHADEEQELVEVIDGFDVRWVLALM